MLEPVFPLIDRHESFILTTHDPADADGLGAELVFACILKNLGKSCYIINASPVPEFFRFMDPARQVENWDREKHHLLPEKSAMIMMDTSDEYFTGCMKDLVDKVKEVFVFDHHEPKPMATLTGVIDSSAGSTSEMAVELAGMVKVELDEHTAMAAYSGIVYDTGFFAYSKTSLKTFRSAMKTLEHGAKPYYVYQQLMENGSMSSLLLQKRVLSSLEFHVEKKVAVQVLRKEDLAVTGAFIEDAESFINLPLRSREVVVSILVKENTEGQVRCSLRSKGTVNVSKIARNFGGGGHVSAAGFRSKKNVEETLQEVLAVVEAQLELP